MGKATKATKKFLKNSLEKEKERRNKLRPIKQAVAKRQASRNAKKVAAKAKAEDRERDSDGLPKAIPIEEMDVDDFMGQGFADILNGRGSDDDDSDEEDVSLMKSSNDDNSTDDDGDSDDGEGIDEENADDNDVSLLEGINAGDDEKTADMRNKNKGMLSEITKHKRSLEKLKREQPEFYQFLEQNDKELLDFADEAEDSDEDISEDGDEEADGAGPAVMPDKEDGNVPQTATTDTILRLVGSLKNSSKVKSFTAFRKLVAAFVKACPSPDKEEDREDEQMDSLSGMSMAAQGLVIKSCYLRLPEYLDSQLPIVSKQGRAPALPHSSKPWKKFKGLIKLFLKSIIDLHSLPSDAETEIFLFQSILPICKYFACFPKQNRAFFKIVLSTWSRAADEVRVHAFLAMRQMAVVSPFPFIELCLKGAYLTFIRECKFPVPSVRPTLTFMLNCVVELYRLDEDATYQHAFVYIRQLAVHLRNATVNKKKDSYLQVYNWQYMYSLRVWCKLLSEEIPAGREGLRPLVYPLVQVILGAMRLVPTSRFLPYKVHCLQALISLMEKSGVYIPLSASILESLEVSEMTKKPKPTTGKPINFDNALKIGKKQLSTPQFQDAIVSSVIGLSTQYYGALATSISFPEAVYPDVVRIRKFLKGCKAKHVVKKVKVLLEKIEENSTFIAGRRANVPFSPKDVGKAEAWSASLRAEGKSPMQRHSKVWMAAELNRKKLRDSEQEVEGKDYVAPKSATSEDEGDRPETISTITDRATKKRKIDSKKAVSQDAKVTENDSAAVDDDGDDDDVIESFAMEDFEFDSD